MNEGEQNLVNKMNHELGEVKGKLVGIEEKIEETRETQVVMHQENQGNLKEVRDILTRIESKQNKDIIQFNQAKEEITKRIDPIERDFIARMEAKKDVNTRFLSLLWDLLKIGIIAAIGYATAMFKNPQ